MATPTNLARRACDERVANSWRRWHTEVPRKSLKREGVVGEGASILHIRARYERAANSWRRWQTDEPRKSSKGGGGCGGGYQHPPYTIGLKYPAKSRIYNAYNTHAQVRCQKSTPKDTLAHSWLKSAQGTIGFQRIVTAGHNDVTPCRALKRGLPSSSRAKFMQFCEINGCIYVAMCNFCFHGFNSAKITKCASGGWNSCKMLANSKEDLLGTPFSSAKEWCR